MDEQFSKFVSYSVVTYIFLIRFWWSDDSVNLFTFLVQVGLPYSFVSTKRAVIVSLCFFIEGCFRRWLSQCNSFNRPEVRYSIFYFLFASYPIQQTIFNIFEFKYWCIFDLIYLYTIAVFAQFKQGVLGYKMFTLTIRLLIRL